MPTCPHCRHTWTTSRAKPKAEPTATAAMTTEQLFKHYHDSAPAEDIKFFLAHAYISDGLRLWFRGLELARPNLTRAEFYRQYRGLQDRWRSERYWERVVVPAARIARRLEAARRRFPTSDERTVAA